MRKSELYAPSTEYLDATGTFYFKGSHTWSAGGVERNIPGAVYEVTFKDEHGLAAFLDFYLAEGDDGTVARLYLTARPAGAEAPVANLRFQFNREHQVAAAVVVAAGRDANHYWMTRGDSGRVDLSLSHDTWDPEDATFPPESFITVADLRVVVRQWVFGEVLPPPAVRWTQVPELRWL